MKSGDLKNNNFLFFLAIISGLLLSFSFPPFKFGWLVFFAFIPLFWAAKNSSTKKSFWLGSTAGLIYFAFSSRWFLATFPLDWAGVNSQVAAAFLLIFFWLLNASFLALFWGVFSWLTKKYFSFTKITALGLPFLFVLIEYVRALGLSLFWLGPESQVGAFWTFFSPAYSLSNYFTWRNITQLGGIYLLDILIILVNLALFVFVFSFFKNKKNSVIRIFFSITLLLLLFVNLFSFLPKTEEAGESEQKISVFAIQTKDSSLFKKTASENVNRFKQQAELLKEISQKNFQKAIIFMPEDSRFLTNFPQAAKINLELLFKDKQFLLIDSSRTKTTQGVQNIINFYDHNQKQIIASSPKIFLIPGGEYLPYLVKFLAILLGQGDFIEKFNASRQYFSQDGLQVANWQEIKVGGELCSSVMSPGIYFQAKNQGAQILFNLASHSSFKGSWPLQQQTLAMARIRATENQTPFVAATNFGQSFILDSNGKIIAKTDNSQPQVLEAQITPNSKNSFSHWGQKIILLISILMVLFLPLWSEKILHKKHF